MPANTITIEEVKALMQQGKTLTLIDVRTPTEFAQVHATGAKLLPLDELNPAAFAESHSNAQEPVYVLCHAGTRAAKACQRFIEAGMTNVYAIEGGTAAWEKQGLPVERSSSRRISLERQVRIAAGALVLLGTILGWTVHQAFLGIPAFVGAGLMFAGITDSCAMGVLLSKMPWNR